MVSTTDFKKANRTARWTERTVPKAASARYDRHTRRIVIQLTSNLGIFFSPRNAQGLENATADQLSEIEISPSGYGLHFPQIDADLYLPALLEGVFGSERWTASRMGASGGKSTSKAKSAASRANGKKGGRPRRVAASA